MLIQMENPWVYLQTQIFAELERVLKKLHVTTISSEDLKRLVEEPPDPKLGDFAATLCFPLAKILKKAPRQIADIFLKEINLKNLPSFSKVEIAGPGYINFFINWTQFNSIVLNQITVLKENYGNATLGDGKKAIVEHTSPNPTKPLHMGTMRCAVIGDITARVLKKAGYNVEIENYMDDLGRQVAVLTWAFLNLDRKEYEDAAPGKKEDFKLGLFYTKASQEIEKDAKACKAIEKEPQLEMEVQNIIARLEVGDPEVSPIAEDLVDKALRGQLETAWRMNIFYNLLIWESDVIASGIFEETLTKLLQSQNVYRIEEGEDEGCIVVNMSEFGKTYQEMEKPYKIIVRSNNVATYTGRDIGLHFFKMNLVKGQFKFRKWGVQPDNQVLWETAKEGEYSDRFGHGDLAINVIGYEQAFPQQVVFHALKISGYEKEYRNSHHLSFKWVWLPGQQAFSGRKGTWVGFEADAALDKAVELALHEVEKRHKNEFSEELMKDIAEKIGAGAVKYYLAKFSPEKDINIKWEDVLNFEGESAPYIQYAFVRTQGIFRKSSEMNYHPNPSLLTHETEEKLIRMMAQFPNIILEVAANYNVHKIATYALELADTFNEFYHQVPVLKADTEELVASRLELVHAMNILLKILLVDLLGIQVPDRM
jgi:arginyl-tRNA synthetase